MVGNSVERSNGVWNLGLDRVAIVAGFGLQPTGAGVSHPRTRCQERGFHTPAPPWDI